MKKVNKLISIIQNESTAHKFDMVTDEDYRAFLMGKILLTADQVDYNRYVKADKWISSFHIAAELEDYLEDLFAEVESLNKLR